MGCAMYLLVADSLGVKCQRVAQFNATIIIQLYPVVSATPCRLWPAHFNALSAGFYFGDSDE